MMKRHSDGMIARMVANSSRPGELIYDPFCGSGSTLLAAHQLGRIGYGCEMDPGYVAVEQSGGKVSPAGISTHDLIAVRGAPIDASFRRIRGRSANDPPRRQAPASALVPLYVDDTLSSPTRGAPRSQNVGLRTLVHQLNCNAALPASEPNRPLLSKPRPTLC
jgi:hypothetical protein